MSALDPARQLTDLFALFADTHIVDPPDFQVVPASQVPQPYHELLVHDQHMTVTLERFHSQRVHLTVLARRRQENDYARMILLSLEGSGEIVEFGTVRMDLSCVSEAVRAAIVAGRTPLGRVLIEHNVLRHIDPIGYLRIAPSQQLRAWFNAPDTDPIFGRVAIITCNGQPAVQLLEIVRPEPAATRAALP
jgi:chorismate-pyruvate lyase